MAIDPTRLTPVPRRGRPRADVPSTAVTTWVPTALHDKLCAIAKQEELSVSGLVRKIVVFQLHHK